MGLLRRDPPQLICSSWQPQWSTTTGRFRVHIFYGPLPTLWIPRKSQAPRARGCLDDNSQSRNGPRKISRRSARDSEEPTQSSSFAEGNNKHQLPLNGNFKRHTKAHRRLFIRVDREGPPAQATVSETSHRACRTPREIIKRASWPAHAPRGRRLLQHIGNSTVARPRRARLGALRGRRHDVAKT